MPLAIIEVIKYKCPCKDGDSLWVWYHQNIKNILLSLLSLFRQRKFISKSCKDSGVFFSFCPIPEGCKNLILLSRVLSSRVQRYCSRDWAAISRDRDDTPHAPHILNTVPRGSPLALNVKKISLKRLVFVYALYGPSPSNSRLDIAEQPLYIWSRVRPTTKDKEI